MLSSIAIDARPLCRPGSEAFDYTLHLCHSLAYVDQSTVFHLFVDEPPDPQWVPRGEHVKVAVLGGSRPLWKASLLGPAAVAAGAQVLHVQGLPPVAPPLPVVTTLRHLDPLTQPQRYPRSRFAWRHLLPRLAPRAAQVIVPWLTVRDQVVARLGVAAERIAVIPYGVESVFAPQCDSVVSMLRDKLELPERYVLGCRAGGTAEELVAVWRRAREAHGLAADLVLDGAEADGEGIHSVGSPTPLPVEIRPALYAGAVGTLLGSGGEAAALLLLETLASGTPAVGPESDLLAEAAGRLAVLGDVDAQAAALARWERDEAERTRRMRGGLARARLYSWPQMAQRTLDVYRAALGLPSEAGEA